MTRKFGAGLAMGIVGTILVGLAAWLMVAYTGAYNVAASDPHADVVRWTLKKTMRRSVSSRAGGVDLPKTVSEDLLAMGAGHYAEDCAHCHGAPGAEPAEWSRGMRPEPPHLMEAASEWTPEEIHWIVTHGIKMSGMPAFGTHLSPEELAALTEFVSALPGLSTDDYAKLTRSAPEGEEQAPPATAEEGESKAEGPTQ